jgi:hypothetical protein
MHAAKAPAISRFELKGPNNQILFSHPDLSELLEFGHTTGCIQFKRKHNHATRTRMDSFRGRNVKIGALLLTQEYTLSPGYTIVGR